MQRGYTVVEEVREVASGLNDKRPKLTRILKVLAEGGADIILARAKKDAMQELIEDMISVVQSFSARLYGRRSQV